MIIKPLEDYLELEENPLIFVIWKQSTSRVSLLTKVAFQWMGWGAPCQVRGP